MYASQPLNLLHEGTVFQDRVCLRRLWKKHAISDATMLSNPSRSCPPEMTRAHMTAPKGPSDRVGREVEVMIQQILGA